MLRIFRHYCSAPALFLCVCETLAVALALYAAASMLLPADAAGGRLIAAALVPALVNAVLMFGMGLYDPPHVANFRRALPRLVACLCIGAPILGRSLSFAGTGETQTLYYLAWTVLVVACIVLARMLATPLARTGFSPRRVVVVGAGRLAAEIEQLMARAHAHSRTEVSGYVALGNETREVPEARLKSSEAPLLDVVRNSAAKEIVVAADDRRGISLQPLLDARMEGVTVTSFLSFWERETRRVNLRALDPSWLIFSDGFHIGSATNAVLKRALDITASVLLLLLTLPTLLVAAIAIKLDSKGPILYRQERIGRRGQIFHIAKFRTMRVDAEQMSGPQWASVDDPRVTRVGRFLRRMRIDELPQILNVLRGEMSFVGPRPERPHFVRHLAAEIPFYQERHRVRPGITGWAQINYPYGASIEDAREKLSYDLYYIKNFSFLFDLLIILSTAKAVFLDGGGR
ncbi:MAG TPA: TIGR03013 family XrtA/PEP-CTERM system glycosyltransferase [Stellaceae bacterium]|nr:TIGR03013 family XrtA/PEP-CTERM system glycosyltransferase [Stellaceae bacterium]